MTGTAGFQYSADRVDEDSSVVEREGIARGDAEKLRLGTPTVPSGREENKVDIPAFQSVEDQVGTLGVGLAMGGELPGSDASSSRFEVGELRKVSWREAWRLSLGELFGLTQPLKGLSSSKGGVGDSDVVRGERDPFEIKDGIEFESSSAWLDSASSSSS